MDRQEQLCTHLLAGECPCAICVHVLIVSNVPWYHGSERHKRTWYKMRVHVSYLSILYANKRTTFGADRAVQKSEVDASVEVLRSCEGVGGLGTGGSELKSGVGDR